jgi:hypothetical protein
MRPSQNSHLKDYLGYMFREDDEMSEHQKNILVVEDNPVAAKMLLGCQVGQVIFVYLKLRRRSVKEDHAAPKITAPKNLKL